MSRESWDERYGVEELIFKSEPNRFLVEEVESLSRSGTRPCLRGRPQLGVAGLQGVAGNRC